MQATTTELTTTGGTVTDNIIVYPIGDYPYTNCWPNVQYIYWPSEPQMCMGKAHVFECEHVSKCKCGAITRVMPKAKRDGVRP